MTNLVNSTTEAYNVIPNRRHYHYFKSRKCVWFTCNHSTDNTGIITIMNESWSKPSHFYDSHLDNIKQVRIISVYKGISTHFRHLLAFVNCMLVCAGMVVVSVGVGVYLYNYIGLHFSLDSYTNQFAPNQFRTKPCRYKKGFNWLET